MPTNKKMRSRSSKKSMKGGFIKKIKTSNKANEYMRQLQIAALSRELAREKKIKNNRLKENSKLFEKTLKSNSHKTRYNNLIKHTPRAPVMWTGFEPKKFNNSKAFITKKEKKFYNNLNTARNFPIERTTHNNRLPFNDPQTGF